MKNIAPLHGFLPHHDAKCDMEFRHKGNPTRDHPTPYRAYFCNTHKQWCYESPRKVIYVFQHEVLTKESA